VPEEGIEPTRALSPPDFESGASASFTTPARSTQYTGARGILARHSPITAKSQELMTHIGTSVDFDGDLTCDEDVTFEGRLTGNIHVREGTLIVGQPAHVEASIRAARVIVHGTVQGSISAGQRIELASTAAVTGDLSATQVVITDGAKFNGRVDMGRRTIAAKVAQYKAATK
jgi:cytoskeletal protein CcmA (bactofilin family)